MIGFAISLLVPALILAWNTSETYRTELDTAYQFNYRFAREFLSPLAASSIRLGAKEELTPFVIRFTNLSEIHSVTILDQVGDVFVERTKGPIPHQEDLIRHEIPIEYYPIVGNEGLEFDGEEQAFQANPQTVGSLIIHSYPIDTSQLWLDILVGQPLALITAILVCSFFTLLLTRSITDPLNGLMKAVKEVDYSDRTKNQLLKDSQDDELSDLTRVLFASTATAQKNQLQVQETNEELIRTAEKLEKQMARTQEATEELMASNDRKDQFISNFSHEFKLPLSSIISNIEFIKQETGLIWQALSAHASDPQFKPFIVSLHSVDEFLRMLQDSSDRLKNLVEEVNYAILDVSDHEPCIHTSINLKKNIRAVIDQHAGHIADKGLSLFTNLQIDDDLIVHTDWARTEKSLHLVLSNAENFTMTGSITVKAHIKEERNAYRLILDVVDTGPGIPRSASNKIFDRFYIIEDPAVKISGGMGVGLANARSLIHPIGGKLFLKESHIGSGSTFRFDIPFNSSLEAPPPIDLDPKSLSGISILHVEDSKAHRSIFELYWKGSGVTISHASSAKTALSLLENQSFDVIVADCHMPIMDGPEMVAIIRERESTKELKRTPLVALTADDSPRNHQKCMMAGFDAFYTKPFRKDKLYAMVAEIHALLNEPAEKRAK